MYKRRQTKFTELIKKLDLHCLQHIKLMSSCNVEIHFESSLSKTLLVGGLYS